MVTLESVERLSDRPGIVAIVRDDHLERAGEFFTGQADQLEQRAVRFPALSDRRERLPMTWDEHLALLFDELGAGVGVLSE
ncbi:MAG: hypothetical protein ACR2LV_11655 [Solirubrobacteraceae bacterium]